MSMVPWCLRSKLALVSADSHSRTSDVGDKMQLDQAARMHEIAKSNACADQATAAVPVWGAEELAELMEVTLSSSTGKVFVSHVYPHDTVDTLTAKCQDKQG